MQIRKRTIIFLFLAGAELLSIGAGALLALKTAHDTQADQGIAAPRPVPESVFAFSGIQVVVPESAQNCDKNDQCLAVDTHCGYCCRYQPLNALHESSFNAAFKRHCETYTEAPCSCHDLSSYPACIKGKCQLVKWPDGAEGQ